jgi:hypothetical protein
MHCQLKIEFLDIAINEGCQLTFGQRAYFLRRWNTVLK